MDKRLLLYIPGMREHMGRIQVVLEPLGWRVTPVPDARVMRRALMRLLGHSGLKAVLMATKQPAGFVVPLSVHPVVVATTGEWGRQRSIMPVLAEIVAKLNAIEQGA